MFAPWTAKRKRNKRFQQVFLAFLGVIKMSSEYRAAILHCTTLDLND